MKNNVLIISGMLLTMVSIYKAISANHEISVQFYTALAIISMVIIIRASEKS